MICCVACDRRSSWLRHRRPKKKANKERGTYRQYQSGAGRSLSHKMKSVGGGLPPRARSFAVHCARWPGLCRQTRIRACATEKDRAGINGVITSRSRSGLAMDHGLWLRDRQHASRGNPGPVVQLGVSTLARDPANCSGRLIWCWRGLAINAGRRIARPISTPWHALGAHGAAIIATVLLGALFGRFLGNRKLHIGGGSS